jgi:AcrR family transcriptional regulator
MDMHPTKQSILDLAIAIVEERGEAALRLQEIQETLSVSPPSIYNFFGSREGLLAAVHEARFSRSLVEFQEPVQQLLAECNSSEDLRSALRASLQAIFEPSRSAARMDRISALAATVGRPELAARLSEISRRHHEVLAASLRAAQDRGFILPNVDLEAFITWFSGQILGRIYVEVGQPSEAHPAWDEIAERAAAFILFGTP